MSNPRWNILAAVTASVPVAQQHIALPRPFHIWASIGVGPDKLICCSFADKYRQVVWASTEGETLLEHRDIVSSLSIKRLIHMSFTKVMLLVIRLNSYRNRHSRSNWTRLVLKVSSETIKSFVPLH